MVVTQGDVGDRYFVIESGEAEVIGDGRVVATLGAGEGFGEIALLRRSRRTATVRAAQRAAAPGAALRPLPARRARLHAECPRGGHAWSTRCSTASRRGRRRDRR